MRLQWRLLIILACYFLIISGCSRNPLKNKSPEERFRIVWKLQWDDPAWYELDEIETLIQALKDDEKSVRQTAAVLLGEFNPLVEKNIKKIIPALISALKDDEWIVRRSAIGSLGWYGPYAKEAVPSLALALKDPIWQVRWSAAFVIADIDPFAKEVLPICYEVLETESKQEVREALEEAIATLGGKTSP